MTNTYALDLAEFIAESILEKKGRDIKIINLGKKSDVTDYFVIATVESELQMRAIANWIKSELDERKVKATGVDGDIKSSDWIVMDYFNVIVHLFKAETRQRYNIEGMWADAEITDFTEESVGK
jgi:ribosome-associated protein